MEQARARDLQLVKTSPRRLTSYGHRLLLAAQRRLAAQGIPTASSAHTHRPLPPSSPASSESNSDSNLDSGSELGSSSKRGTAVPSKKRQRADAPQAKVTLSGCGSMPPCRHYLYCVRSSTAGQLKLVPGPASNRGVGRQQRGVLSSSSSSSSSAPASISSGSDDERRLPEDVPVADLRNSTPSPAPTPLPPSTLVAPRKDAVYKACEHPVVDTFIQVVCRGPLAPAEVGKSGNLLYWR